MNLKRTAQWIVFVSRLCVLGTLVLLAAPLCAQTTTPIFVELNSPAPTAVAAFAAAEAGQTFDEVTYRATVLLSQDTFLQQLTASGIAYTVTNTTLQLASGTVTLPDRYTDLINAVHMTVAPADVARVRANPHVKHITVDVPLQLHLNTSVPYIRANCPPPNTTTGCTSARNNGLRGTGTINSNGSSSGQVIAVLDTGIFHAHPMFDTTKTDAQFDQRIPPGDPRPVRVQGSPYVAGFNHPKVVYRFLFSTAPAEGDDTGHGTMVASTAAGLKARTLITETTPDEQNVVLEGVAPGALLMDYKVCPSLVCTGTQILLALQDAAADRDLAGFSKPRATVVNMSFGSSSGDPNSANAVAAGNLQFQGVVPEASAGNDGPNENTINSPAAGRLVLATAATTNPGNAPNSIDVLAAAPNNKKLLAFFAPDSNHRMNLTMPLVRNYVDVGFADPGQVGPSVNNQICLAQRGGTVGLFAEKANNCAAFGAVAAVIYNNQPGEIGVVLAPTANIPVFTISQEDGSFLKSLGFNSTTGLSNVQVRINPVDPSLFTPDTAGFSSRGPQKTFHVVKPDITAPGVQILMGASPTGIPVILADPDFYNRADGTSFSGPHVSGAAALVRDANVVGGGRPDFSPSQVRAALMNSATNLRNGDGTAIPNGDRRNFIHATGGGLTEMVRATSVKAVMGTNELNGLDGPDNPRNPNFLPSFSFGQQPWIGTNLSPADPRQRKTVTVTMADVTRARLGGAYTLALVDGGGNSGTVTRPIIGTSGFSVSLSQNSVNIPPGGRTALDVTVAVDGTATGLQLAGTDPTGAKATEFLWFAVATRTDGTETLRMPFYLRVVQGCPGGGEVQDAEGDGEIDDDTGHRDSFRAVAQAGCPPAGEVDFDDENNADPSVHLRGNVTSVSISGTVATLSGPCVLLSGSVCTFTVTLEDYADPGQGADRFTITWTTVAGVSFRASGFLTSGNTRVPAH